MTTREINALMALRGFTPSKVADKINERLRQLPKGHPDKKPVDRSQVSQTLNYLRENPRQRRLIAGVFGMPVEELFEPWPVPAQPPQSAASRV
jgi:hypothetical protein